MNVESGGGSRMQIILDGIENDPDMKEAERVQQEKREIFANWLKKKDGGEMPELVKPGGFSEKSIDSESEVAASNQEPEKQINLAFLEPIEKKERREKIEKDKGDKKENQKDDRHKKKGIEKKKLKNWD